MKRRIRLTESDLHNIIKESVNNILTELDWRTAERAGEIASKKASHFDTNRYDKIRYDRQADKFFDYSRKKNNTQYGFPEDFDNNWEKNNEEAKEMKNGKDYEYNPETNKARPINQYGKPIDYNWWMTVPKEFHPTQGQLKKLSQRDTDTRDYYNNKSEYRNGKWRRKGVIDKDESDFQASRAYKKQPSTLNKGWEDVLNYDYNI
jgi:hypothetical protein